MSEAPALDLGLIEIVLCQPTDPRNVGAAIRAAANHGLGGVRLVTTERFGPDSLSNLSAGATGAVPWTYFDELDAALADRRLVLATSRRAHDDDAPPGWPAAGLGARLAGQGPVAILFGTERSGLTRAEIDRADALIHVPTHTRFPSLNLSHAVACIGYELARGPEWPLPETPPQRTLVPARDALFRQVREACAEIGYPPGRTPEGFARRLKRLVTRANPTAGELDLLAGLFRELRRLGRRP